MRRLALAAVCLAVLALAGADAPPSTTTAADVSLLKFTPRVDTHFEPFEGELSVYVACGGGAAVDLPGEEVLGERARYPAGRVVVARLAANECATCRFRVRRRLPFVEDDTVGPPFDLCASDFAAAEGGQLSKDARAAFDATFACGECGHAAAEPKAAAAAAAAPPPAAPRRGLSGGAVAAVVVSCLVAGGGVGAVAVLAARRAAAAAERARAAEFAAVFSSEGDVELDQVTVSASADGAPFLARLARSAKLYDTSVV